MKLEMDHDVGVVGDTLYNIPSGGCGIIPSFAKRIEKSLELT